MQAMLQQTRDQTPSRRRQLLLALCAATVVVASLVLFRPVDDGPPPAPGSDPVPPAGSRPPDVQPSAEEGAGRVATSQVGMDHYHELLELARSDPRAFRARVESLLSTPSDASARWAALRAWHDARQADPVPALARALTDVDFGPAGRTLALELLQPRCMADTRAREALIEFLRLRPDDVGQRASAFEHVLRWGDGDQIRACVPLLHAEADPDVVVAAARALQSSHTPGARTTAEALHWRHPDAAVRQRLRALGIGK